MGSRFYILLANLCLTQLTLLPIVQCKKFLLLPFPWKSHVFEITAIGDALHTRGHELSILLPPTYPDIEQARKWPNYKVIEYEVAEPDIHSALFDQTDADLFFQEILQKTPIQDFRENVEGFVQFCSNPLRDKALLKRLAADHYDMGLVDAFPGSRCLMVILYNLGLPYVSLATQYEPWLWRNPALPSHVPFPLAQKYTEQMSLRERIENLLITLGWVYVPRVPYLEDDFIAPFIAIEKAPITLNELARRTVLWLVDTDVVLDYPRPTMPHEVHVGGLSTKPAKKLPDDIRSFLDGATDGAVVIAFGSTSGLGINIFDKMLDAFSRLKLRVIWRYENLEMIKGRKIPRHILIREWIPQNDILAHPNMKLFITHCGTNGQFEAVYHGIPMLGFPMFADQPYNARRMTYHGFGKYLDMLTFTPESLRGAIQDIIGNQSHYDNIRKASEIFKNRPLNPRERAAYRVEEVLRFGGGHLRSHALNLPWYEFYMLDLLLIFHLALLAVVVTSLMLLCCVLRCLRRTGGAPVKVKQG